MALSALALFSILLLAPFVVYPAVVMGASLLASRREDRGPAGRELPRIAILIAARDEREALEAKLANTLALDYPEDRRVIRVLSDGSVDGTDAVARAHAEAGVQLFRMDSSPGKTETAARGVADLDVDVLVFTDATSHVSSEALHALVRAVQEPGVGCATGRVTWSGGEGAIGRGFRAYARLDCALRRSEAAGGGPVVGSGALHAVRREVVASAPADLSYDLVLPLLASSQGLATAYVDEAVALEAARERVATEWRARVRLGVRSFRFALWALGASSPRPRLGWWLHFLGHKLLRWLGGVWLLGASVSAAWAASDSMIALGVGVGILGALSAAILGLLPGGRRIPGVGLALFIGTVLVAYVVALAQALAGHRVAAWSPEREGVTPREST